MKKMTKKEMKYIVENCKWATICTVTGDMKPYAIEATPFMDRGDICFMINPKGQTSKNFKTCPEVLLKFTVASEDLNQWAGVSCFGTGEFVSDKDDIKRGWKLLEQVTGHDYSEASAKFTGKNLSSPLLRVKISSMTGRSSGGYNAGQQD